MPSLSTHLRPEDEHRQPFIDNAPFEQKHEVGKLFFGKFYSPRTFFKKIASLSCPSCDYVTYDEYLLNEHSETYHETFNCKYCSNLGEIISSKSELTRHMMEAHRWGGIIYILLSQVSNYFDFFLFPFLIQGSSSATVAMSTANQRMPFRSTRELTITSECFSFFFSSVMAVSEIWRFSFQK